MGPKDVDQCVFRYKSPHATPHQDAKRPWIWQMVVACTATEKFRLAINAISQFEAKFPGITVAPQKTEDGPLAKDIGAWLKGGGYEENLGDDEDDGESSKKRGRAGKKA